MNTHKLRKRHLNVYGFFLLGLRLDKRIEEAAPAAQQLQELGRRLRCDDSGSEHVSLFHLFLKIIRNSHIPLRYFTSLIFDLWFRAFFFRIFLQFASVISDVSLRYD